MTTGIGIVVRTAVHVRVHNRHTINDMRVNEEIYLNIIRSKKQQQSHCRYPCDSMFFTFHAAKVQRIFGTAKFLAKKITERTILIKNVQFFCYIFCLSGRAVICIVYLAGDTIAALRTSALRTSALRTSALAMASAIAFMAVHSAREQRPLLGT